MKKTLKRRRHGERDDALSSFRLHFSVRFFTFFLAFGPERRERWWKTGDLLARRRAKSNDNNNSR